MTLASERTWAEAGRLQVTFDFFVGYPNTLVFIVRTLVSTVGPEAVVRKDWYGAGRVPRSTALPEGHRRVDGGER